MPIMYNLSINAAVFPANLKHYSSANLAYKMSRHAVFVRGRPSLELWCSSGCGHVSDCCLHTVRILLPRRLVAPHTATHLRQIPTKRARRVLGSVVRGVVVIGTWLTPGRRSSCCRPPSAGAPAADSACSSAAVSGRRSAATDPLSCLAL